MKKVLQVYKQTDTLILRFPELDYDHTVSRQVKKSLPNLIMKYSPKALVFDLKQIEEVNKEGYASIILSWNLCCSRNVQLIINGLKEDNPGKQGVSSLIDTTETLKEALQLAINSAHVEEIHTVVSKNMTKVFGDLATNPQTASQSKIATIKQKLLTNKQECLTA